MELSGIRKDVFMDRYARKDEDGKAVESAPEQMWDRVAAAIAEVEDPAVRGEWTTRFRQALDGFKFVPGGRILAGAGTGQKVTFYNCLPPDQPVLTPDGEVPIAEIDVRDYVITGQGRARIVTRVFAREADEPMYRIMVAGGGLLRLTGNHPVLARRSGGDAAAWVRAAELTEGDLVGGLDGGAGPAWHVSKDEPVGWSPRGGSQVLVRERRETYRGVAWRAIESVESLPYCGTVYDLEVEEDHSFLSSGVIVSNCYVIPSPEDSRRGIMDSVGLMVEIMSRGGGVGVNLSSLRPRGSYVRGVNGTASGPVSWGEVYSTATGAVIQGGCFGPDVRIATDRGLIPAAELADRLEAGEPMQALTHEGPRPLTWAFRNGVKPLLRVTTARGFQVDVTPDHKMGVLRDGRLATVPMRELGVGDEVLTFLGEAVDAPLVELRPVHYERDQYGSALNDQIYFPDRLTPGLAYVLGYLYADGNVHTMRR
ncbi:MAG TPA: ribonucleotide reductase N-terminal alpha domain-containing protein, partial [Bacillota bacterium]|nr:ribonucleotide reductase N-terminal alpha domain-containing protein [Bacillota bacterium]